MPGLEFQSILEVRNLRAFKMTDTELRLIAKLAIIGFNKNPKAGYKIPAAKGTPKAL